MQIGEERRDGVIVIAPAGRVDSTTSETLEHALARALDAGERRIVVDFSGVEYISSAGLRVLLVAGKRIRGGLVLCSLPEPVRQVFDLAGFLPLFTIAASRDAALAKLAGTP